MRRLYLIIGLVLCGWLAGLAHAETYKLTTGETVNGELLAASANDLGVQVKVGEGQYQKVPWTSFSQEDLKAFAKNAKLEPFVEPFIEITAEEKAKKTEVAIQQPPRLERPAKQSLFGALFSSSVGLFLVVCLYAANIYAGYEVAVFRAQPFPLVIGLSAIPGLGFLVPIIFLSMRTRLQSSAAVEEEPEPAAQTTAAAAHASAAATPDAVNPMQAETAASPAGMHSSPSAASATAPKPAQSQTQTFQRGQFTFNRRFFETKFAGFMGVTRREEDQNAVLVFKTMRGEFTGQRISRITASDLHLEVQKDSASEEVMIPFQEIQEIRLTR